jgi:hypothetical protein
MLVLLLVACTHPDPAKGASGITFGVDPVDLGAPLASGTGFDPTDGDGVGLAMANVLPVFGTLDDTDNPALATFTDVWAILQGETVRDEGQCPFDRVENDGTSIHEGDCRSSDGYEFTGSLSERSWEDDGAARYRVESDLEVVGDTESAAFDRIRIAGKLEVAEPDSGDVELHLDVNLHIEVEGYWEQRGPDPRADAWRSWTATGAIEERADGWRADVAAEVGDLDGLTLASSSLVETTTCPVEFVGTLDLGDASTAELEGVDSCDGCARVVTDDGTETLACYPDGAR